jgi:hypothetical protein
MRDLPRRAGSEMRGIARGQTVTHLHLRERLVAILGATLVVDLLASVAIYFFERDADGTKITNFGDSIFWVSTQLLTVSSQLPNPISTPARVLDIFLQFWAISVVAALAGSFGAFFNRRSLERAPLALKELERDLINRPLPGSPPPGGSEASRR